MKRIRKILITVCALAMALGTTMMVYAAESTVVKNVAVARVKTFTVTQVTNDKNNGKKASKITAYSNDDAANAKLKVTYTWEDVTVKTADGSTVTKETQAPAEVRVTSADRAVVNVGASLTDVTTTKGKPNETTKKGVTTTTVLNTVTGYVDYDPAANGKAVITIAENTSLKNKKTAKVTVTVQTYAEHIEFGGNVDSIDYPATGEYQAETVKVAKIAKGGKLGLEAVACTDDASNKNIATNQKVKYEITSVTEVQKDGQRYVYVQGENGKANQVTDKKAIAQYASVDGKGNVSIKTGPKTGAYDVFAVAVKVTSADGEADSSTVYAVSQDAANKNAAIQVIPDDAKNTKAILGQVNKKNVLTMKGNRSSSARTYQINFKTNDCNKEDVRFTSSNTAVATVDQQGKVTAAGNGKAVITLDSKYGAKVKAAKVTVNVTTDVEAITVANTYFEILANNKATAKIAGAINKGASKATVKYQIMSVKDDGKTYADSKTIKQYASVSGKGDVKIKKACEATIRVYADKTNVETTVTVKGIAPTKTIVLKSADNTVDSSDKKKNKPTLYNCGSDDDTSGIELSYDAKDVNGSATKATLSSDKTNVAEVIYLKDGKWRVWPVGNGTAKITATADDGSGVKATITVTVKTDAYRIDVPAAQRVSEKELGLSEKDDKVDVVYVKSESKTNVNLAKTIKAATNTDASVKSVSYSIDGNAVTKVAMNVGDVKKVDIQAKDTRAHGSHEEGPVTRTVYLSCIDSTKIANEYQVEIDGEGFFMGENVAAQKVGDTRIVPAKVAAKEGTTGVVLDPNALTYKVKEGNAVTVDKNGKITAKKPGCATIHVSYNEGKTEKAYAEFQVIVGRKDADISKEVNSVITTSLKAENYDYLGIKTSFDAKNNTFNLAILDPSKDFRNIENTGLVTALSDIVKNSTLVYRRVGVDGYWIERTDASFKIYDNGTLVKETNDVNEAINYVFDNVNDVAEKATLADWNGYYTTITLDLEEPTGIEYKDLDNGSTKYWNNGYELQYTLSVSMSDSLYKGMIDAKINEKLTTLDIPGVCKNGIVYDASENAASVELGDAAQSIKDADTAVRSQVVEALQSVLADAVEVRVSATVSDKGNYSVTKDSYGTVDAAYINSLLDENLEKLTKQGITKYVDLNNSVFTVDVIYMVGANAYSQTYVITAALCEEAFDKAADAEIAKEVGNGKFVFGTVAYDKDKNELNVIFNQEYSQKKPSDLKDTGLMPILSKLVDAAGVDRSEKVIVISDGKAAQVDITEENGSAAVLAAAIAGDAKKIADLNDKDAVVKVTYAAERGNTKAVLSYTINFMACQDVEEEETAAQDAVSDNTIVDELPADDQTPADETPADDETPAEETPADDENAGSDETPADDENAGSDETPADDENAGSDETPADDENAGSDETPADDENAGSDETPADDVNADAEELAAEEVTVE